MTEWLLYAMVAVTGLDAALATGLLVTFGLAYKGLRVPFTGGLLLFAGFFVAQNLVAMYAYLTMMPLMPSEVIPYLVTIGILEAGGLAVMLRAGAS